MREFDLADYIAQPPRTHLPFPMDTSRRWDAAENINSTAQAWQDIQEEGHLAAKAEKTSLHSALKRTLSFATASPLQYILHRATTHALRYPAHPATPFHRAWRRHTHRLPGQNTARHALPAAAGGTSFLLCAHLLPPLVPCAYLNTHTGLFHLTGHGQLLTCTCHGAGQAWHGQMFKSMGKPPSMPHLEEEDIQQHRLHSLLGRSGVERAGGWRRRHACVGLVGCRDKSSESRHAPHHRAGHAFLPHAFFPPWEVEWWMMDQWGSGGWSKHNSTGTACRPHHFTSHHLFS